MSVTQICDTETTARLLDAFLADLEHRVTEPGWALVGIQRRGDLLAERLRSRVRARGGPELPFGVLDITLYRDDFSPGRTQPTVRPSQIPFDVEGARILLIDDVFQTGRTIRAALQQISDFGRPRQVALAVFIDREQRELPICPDHVGVLIARDPEDRVQLRLQEIDGQDEVVVLGGPAHA
ncbi:MAG: bifunctional pyr operon transcriptional regulator/uracil phosphoribosyltransferase PyrR [Planctomycetota bacterium]